MASSRPSSVQNARMAFQLFAPMEALARVIARLLHHAIRHNGLKLPVVLTAISSDGQVMVTRFDQLGPGSRGRILCEYVDGKNFKTPITMFFTDLSGRSASTVIIGSAVSSLH